MDWVDVNNEGISHFGIHPELFPWNEITFDTFHLKCSVSRRLMEELRKLLLEQSTVIQNDFSVKVLSKFLNQFHLFVCGPGKPFSSF